MAVQTPFQRKSTSRWVKITEPTAIRGAHVKVGDVIEVSADDADNLFTALRAVPAEAPAPETAAPKKK